MRVFSLILTSGQLAAALTAIGICLFGIWRIWRWCRKVVAMVVRIFNSVGDINGDGKTIAEHVKESNRRLSELAPRLERANQKLDDFGRWRPTVDHTLAEQNLAMAAMEATLEVLTERHDERRDGKR